MGNCTRWYVCSTNNKIFLNNKRELKSLDMTKKLLFFFINELFGEYSLLSILMTLNYYIS